MKKIMVIVVLALLLISLVSVANASGPVYQPVSQDSEPPKTEEPTEAPTESPTEAPANSSSENNNNDESDAPKGACERAYHYIENTLYNKEAGYSILRSEPWCRVWIFLKYGKSYSIPPIE
ncbi:MAG: hypothetical protein J0L96_02030 [Anaerolineae bacterium]|nr:hypothetical protein [Anaerolineae bacterium]